MKNRLFLGCAILAFIIGGPFPWSQSAVNLPTAPGPNAPAQNITTYCNPISISDYPVGQVVSKSIPGTVSKPGVAEFTVFGNVAKK